MASARRGGSLGQLEHHDTDTRPRQFRQQPDDLRREPALCGGPVDDDAHAQPPFLPSRMEVMERVRDVAVGSVEPEAGQHRSKQADRQRDQHGNRAAHVAAAAEAEGAEAGRLQAALHNVREAAAREAMQAEGKHLAQLSEATGAARRATGALEELSAEKAAGKRIYPPGRQIFQAFAQTPFDAVKVVLLGQDPYHGSGQAHGLSFSVARGIAPPPSLQNIYKELASDLGIGHPGHGNLEHWARQGVLLLNSCLTVEDRRAGAHQGKGWEPFTDAVIHALNSQHDHLVFILWGRKAQDKGASIDRDRHLIITSAHPSPLSAHNGFFGSRPFSRCNDYLVAQGKPPIDWSLA